ncbi:chitinase [Butyrivibrio sp. X503]|uniref:glycosyl hydrolase family 18 protein n=1 Tax=Butyrivibrio sp. X503 TaxID=2364878 RepID=UPI000EA878B3|nr:glycosyl hydrolase family 18 protein [Butyrivibrio sp. X503]RKM58466.1 chitinase [Butyrivibrio sp. X503]
MKKKVIPAIIIIALIFIIGGVYASQLYKDHFSYSSEQKDLNEYFDIKGDTDVAVLLGNQYLEERARLLDGIYYMDFEAVRKYLNGRFYYGKADEALIYTTPDAIITAKIGTGSYESTKEGAKEENYQIARLEDDGTLLVALDYVKKYTNFSYEAFTEPNHLQIDTTWEEQEIATISKDTQLRVRGGVKSAVIEELAAGDKVIVLDQMDKWSKVKSKNSFIGFVENKMLKDKTTSAPIPVTDYAEPEYTSLKKDYKINMGFQNMSGPGGNDSLSEVLSQTKSLNVISPKWFMVSDNSGSVDSFASSSYVDAAHSKGLEVWALFENITYKNNISSAEYLAKASSRKTMIDSVVSKTLACGADGINLDFESIPAEDGQSYIEFVRELSIACRANGLVFSIDNYVPMHFNDHYDLKEQGIVADYVIIMGYDEHYNGSEAGSVASLGYVENGISNALKKVDSSKVINAVPFYTRVWSTKDGKLTSKAYPMKNAKEYLGNHSVTMEWDPETSQNYGEFTSSDGTLNQIWMEDAASLEQKLNVMKSNNIAGIAEWALGMETADVWDVISAYVEG